jgi:hypothetical protein
MRKASLGNKNFLGRTHTPEAREKMRGNKNFLGRTHTPEARKKMSESQLRRWAERRAHAA